MCSHKLYATIIYRTEGQKFYIRYQSCKSMIVNLLAPNLKLWLSGNTFQAFVKLKLLILLFCKFFMHRMFPHIWYCYYTAWLELMQAHTFHTFLKYFTTTAVALQRCWPFFHFIMAMKFSNISYNWSGIGMCTIECKSCIPVLRKTH